MTGAAPCTADICPRRLQVPILFNLSEPQRFQLAQKMVQRDIAAGEVVIRQGHQGARQASGQIWGQG